MATSDRRQRRRLLAGLAPIALALAALPLLAPTCGSSEAGVKTFARSSLIIPMDRCYQSQTDGVTPAAAPANCPQAMDAGDVVRAYGLVYQLIRNDVAVYWVIEGSKTAADAEDFNIQYNGGFPALLYDWTTGGTAATPPTNQNVIRYRGGPFVVDGSDYAKASAVLQQYRTQFSTVNVHVANVAFQGYVKKTMAGGWSAGGTVPPKLALLDIGSGNLTSSGGVNDPKNAEPVISGYLARAGIGSGTAAGNAEGPHGEIYDKLDIEDFQPAIGSTDWRTSRFGAIFEAGGYQILWVPHWLAAGSCSNFSSSTNCSSTLYPTAKTDQVLETIGAFVAAGGDLFAECAGIGSFEGTFTRSSSQNTTTYTIDYPAPCDDASTPAIELCDPSTRFQSTTGMRYSVNGNEVSYNTAIRVPDLTNFASPLLQIGDFTFKPVSGAIDVFRPNYGVGGGDLQPGTVRLIAATGPTPLDQWDFFTLRPASGGRGTIAYLGGHSYSGVQGNFQIGGSRLVLNTLFNLGAGCTESGVACDTGALGVCGQGRLECSGSPPVPTCMPVNQPSDELCNGLDDDCDGLVDEGLETACYDGPGGTQGVGLCRAGIRQCVQQGGVYGFTACQQQVLPGAEVCNALDDDCDGEADEDLTEACYQGPLDTVDPETGQPKGTCKPGTRACEDGNWGSCEDQVLPQPEFCSESGGPVADENCNGFIDEGCVCTDGSKRPCYGGPTGTSGVGLCRSGEQTCAGGGWGACAGERTPATELCTNPGGTPADEDCDGQVDEGCGCAPNDTEACYSGPAGTAGVGLCQAGTRACISGAFAGECVGDITPATADACDGKDNDCDGVVDDGATCASGLQCEVGVCVPATCGSEQPCPEGYGCVAGQGCKLEPNGCGGVTCPAGEACRFGGCSDPCDGVVCGQGAVCASGACVGGACYVTGCPSGQLCLDGACQADPCGGVNCPSGTFCREGFCVQACTFVSCAAGERCGGDGFCEEDLCAGKTCPPGDLCVDGLCEDDACAGVGCGTGQVCHEGVCVDDPCAGVECPAGACSNGQCYSTANPTGVGQSPPAKADEGGCGCNAGGGIGPMGALLLLAIPLARRRRRRGGAALVLAVAALAAATGCKEDEKFDPAKCAATCEGEERCIDHATDALNCGICGQVCGDGNRCVDGVCGPASAVAPRIDTFTPAAVPVGSTDPVTLTVRGERFVEGAKLRAVTPQGAILLDADVTSPTQLTALLDLEDASPTTWQVRVLNPDNVISNSKGLDVVVPSPAITAVAPAQVLAGATEDVTVTGTGLGLSSQCRIENFPTVLEMGLPSTPGAAGTLECTVDAKLLAPGDYLLWVVNEGSLASNRLPFAVVSATPTLTALSPSVGEASTTVAVTLVGTGFDLTSQVRFDGTAIPTTYFGATQLYVSQLVLPACGTGTCDHTVRVRNGAGVDSNALTFRVGAAPPEVTGVSPGTGYQGEVVPVTFQGSNFVVGAVVEAAPPSGAFAPLPSTTPGCPSTCDQVRGTLDLNGKPEGSWLLRVTFPDGTSSTPFSFRVLSNQAILQDANPRGGAQGTSVPVVLTVGNLRSPLSGVRVTFDGQTLVPAPTPSGTTVNVTLALAGKNTGTYPLAVVNPNGAAPSNTLSFNVTPGQPTITGVTPTTAARSDTRTPVTIAGTNFAKPDASGNGGSTVHISAPSVGITDYAIPKADVTVVSPTRIDVSLDTRSGLPATYDVSVWNPGGDPAPQKSPANANARFIITP